MNLQIKKLTPALRQDYLYYFENVAFTDHDEFSMCYCLESHLSSQEDELLDTREKRREKVKDLIHSGVMNGYLIYSDNHIIGWSNADRKSNYVQIAGNKEYLSGADDDRTIAVYCLEIAPDYRGNGISHYMIDYISKNAKADGYKYVEGYPFVDEEFPYQYRGPLKLYKKHGFNMIQKGDYVYVMRKQEKVAKLIGNNSHTTVSLDIKIEVSRHVECMALPQKCHMQNCFISGCFIVILCLQKMRRGIEING